MSIEDIKSLIENVDGKKLSICIPTHPNSHGNISEDRIRFKNAVREIEDEASKDENLQNRLTDLQELHDNDEFWQSQSKTLLILGDEKQLHVHKLPVEFTEVEMVRKTYFVTPLAVAEPLGSEAYVFSINLNEPKLFYYNGLTVDDVEGITFESLDELIEQDNTGSLQQQGGARQSSSPRFHGHGGSNDQKEDDVNLYLSLIAKKLSGYLGDKSAPLILTGDKNRIQQFNEQIDYKHSHDQTIAGNQERTDMAEMNKHVQELINKKVQANIDTKIEEFNDAIGHNKTAAGYAGILEKLELGAVQTLYLPYMRMTNDSVRTGIHEELLIELPRDTDSAIALETLVRETILQGGDILPTYKNTFDTDEPHALLRF